MKKYTYLLLIFALLASSILFIKTVVANPLFSDSYLHLAVGKHIALFQKIPSHYDISYKTTDASLEWFSHSWLSDILLYNLTAPNLQLLSSAVSIVFFAASVTLIWVLFGMLKIGFSARILTIIAILFVVQIYWRIHPIIIISPLYLFISIVHIIALQKKQIKYLALLPLTALLWSNLYGGYIFLPIITQLLYIPVTYFYVERQKYLLMSAQIAALLASFIVSLINPYGFKIYTTFFTFQGTVYLKRAFVSLPNLLSLVNQSFLMENVSTIPYAAFALIIVGCAVSLVYFVIKKDFGFLKRNTIALPLLVLIPISYIYIRFMPLAMLSIALFLATVIDEIQRKGKYSQIITTALLIGLVPYITYLIFFPLKVLSVRSPIEQIRIINSHSLPGNILTTSELTGYTKLYLPHKLNIDLLDEIYDESETLNVLLQSGTFPKDTLKKTLDSKHVNTVLASKESGNFSRSIQTTLTDEWALIYLDSNGALFVRRNKVSESFLKKYELRYLSLVSNLGADPKHIPEATAELEYMLRLYPNNLLYRGQLATLLRIQGRAEKAVGLLYEIPLNLWDYKLFTEMGRLQASMGNCAAAEQFLLQALDDRTETNFSQAVLDLAIVYAGCYQDKDKARHYFERYLSFTIPHTEKEKARKIASDFGINVE